MASRRGWLPREGFVADPVGRLIKKTLLNPSLTVPLLLLAKYTAVGQQFTFSYSQASYALNILVSWGILRVLNNILSQRALSNGVQDTYNWNKEVVVVTGGSDGIGKAVVHLLAKEKIRVAILDVQPLTYQTPPTVKYFKCDISSAAAISNAATEIRSDMGEPTVLMNIAGVAHGKTILEATEAEHRWVYDVNTIAHFLLAKEYLPSMVRRNHGMVVTTASMAGYGVVANNVDYSGSKATAISFHEGLGTELVTRYNAPKVRTLLVTTGGVRTPLLLGWNQPQGFLDYVLDPETVGEEIVKSVLAGQGGQLLLPGSVGLLAPWIRVMPYWMSNPIRNQGEVLTAKWRGRLVEDPNEKYAKE